MYSIDKVVAVESEVINKVAADADVALSAQSAVKAEVEELAPPTAVMPVTDVAVKTSRYEQRESPSVSKAAPAITARTTSMATGQTMDAIIENPNFSIFEEAQKESPEMATTAFTSSPGTRVRA